MVTWPHPLDFMVGEVFLLLEVYCLSLLQEGQLHAGQEMRLPLYSHSLE